MDTQNSSVVDVPDLKLAKVGAKREKKRGAGGWLSGGRGAGSAFSGAAGGAGAGAGGGLFGAGMSLAKLLTILLVSGGLSAGAWMVGNMLGGSPAAGPAAPKVFSDKGGSQKYDDLSGVINGGDKSIPNSLGYVNNDGLTDEQRAAKKAADDAAAAKAAADAQAKADADAKEKALADAKAASATPDAAEPSAGPQAPKLGLSGGKFGSMSSPFGGGGGGLSGGAGLSGGINRGFAGMGGLDGNKGKAGALSAFRSPPKAAATRAAGPTRGHSNAKGFAKQQLDMANGLSRTAASTGKAETASAGAATPFDNNSPQGTAIAGPGLGNGTQAGPADSGGAANPSNGLGGPLGAGDPACSDPNFEPDSTGKCVDRTPPPPGANAAPYQDLINWALGLLALVFIINAIAIAFSDAQWTKDYSVALGWVECALGAAIAGIGVRIATMEHGDYMIGGILGAVGAFIAVQGLFVARGWNALVGEGPMNIVNSACPTMIAAAVGGLAAASSKMSQAAMQ